MLNKIDIYSNVRYFTYNVKGIPDQRSHMVHQLRCFCANSSTATRSSS